jgi:hypothetical protein
VTVLIAASLCRQQGLVRFVLDVRTSLTVESRIVSLNSCHDGDAVVVLRADGDQSSWLTTKCEFRRAALRFDEPSSKSDKFKNLLESN